MTPLTPTSGVIGGRPRRRQARPGTIGLVPDRVVLHVGTPKSGTTYLQSRLVANVAALAEHDVHVPVAPPAQGRDTYAFRAALDLTGVRMGRGPGYSAGWWDRLVTDAAAGSGTWLVSHESFSRCEPEHAARAVEELGRGGAEVSVVVTARDLGRTLVSGWVEGVKHGSTLRLAEYLERARDGDLPILAQLDLARLAEVWTGVLPPDRVHVVTAASDGGERDLLWTRFLAACGVDPAWAPEDARRANDALGLPETQVLLALNRELGQAARRGSRFHDLLRGTVVGRGLAGRDSERVRLDPAHVAWVTRVSRDWVGAVVAAGVVVTGDLDDLRPAPVDAGSWVDPDVPHPDVAVAAAAALKAVVKEAYRRGEDPRDPARRSTQG